MVPERLVRRRQPWPPAQRRRPGRKPALVAGGATPREQPRLVDVGQPGRVHERRLAAGGGRGRNGGPPARRQRRPRHPGLEAAPRSRARGRRSRSGRRRTCSPTWIVVDRVTLRDVDAGRVLWHTDRYAAPISELQWSADRKRLLVRAGSFVDFLDARGRALSRVTWPTLGVSMSPDNKRTAFIRRTKQGRSEVVVTGRYGEGQPRPVLTRAGRLTDPTWSPDGKWLLVARRDADQWLFIRPSRPVRVDAVANISRQFAPGASRPTALPGDQRLGPLTFRTSDRLTPASPGGGRGPARPRRRSGARRWRAWRRSAAGSAPARGA